MFGCACIRMGVSVCACACSCVCMCLSVCTNAWMLEWKKNCIPGQVREPDQADAAPQFFGLVTDWNYGFRNADDGVSLLDADAQLRQYVIPSSETPETFSIQFQDGSFVPQSAMINHNLCENIFFSIGNPGSRDKSMQWVVRIQPNGNMSDLKYELPVLSFQAIGFI